MTMGNYTAHKLMTRLESATPGGQAEQGLELMPGFLELSCRHKAGAYAAISNSPAWAGLMTPFSKSASQAKITAGIGTRLDALIPVMQKEAGEDAVQVFMCLLIHPDMAALDARWAARGK